MFRKRQRRTFPAGTFIATPARVMAIIQLTLALTVLLWRLSQPFLGDLFEARSRLTVYEFVTKQTEAFETLPLKTQKTILTKQTYWNNQIQTSFFKKVKQSISGLLLETPLFELGWIVFSLLLPILLLLKIEGAVIVVWLIPLLAFGYATDNLWYGKPPQLSSELRLFPSEKYLVEHYTTEPLDANPFNHKNALEAAWKQYLVKEWSENLASTPIDHFDSALDRGEYAFQVARATKIEPPSHQPVRQPTQLLIFYILWNIFFAYMSTKKWKRVNIIDTEI